MKTRTQRAAGSAQNENRPSSLPARRALRAARCLIAVLLFVVPLFAQTSNVKVPDADTLVGAPKGQPLAGDELTRTTQEIASTIRCPVCQGLSIADSPAEMAQNMKAQVRELLSRGYTRDQILSYFERSYGQFVLLKPKFQGVTTLVWTLPIFALILGVVIVFMKMKSLEQAPVASSDNQQPTTDNSQDPYLARVRDLVKGDQQ
ncbi:MAG TPA: cytochrome c-type biogenesis protein [Thermoanaerobaculia bacterium]